MFLAARAWPQEWSSSKTSEIFGTKILLKCGVEPCFLRHGFDHKNDHRP